MKRAEFIAIVKHAKNGTIPRTIDDDGHQTAFGENTFIAFDGCALHNDRIISTRDQFAAMINYQALQLNGEYDTEALQEMEQISKRVDIID